MMTAPTLHASRFDAVASQPGVAEGAAEPAEPKTIIPVFGRRTKRYRSAL